MKLNKIILATIALTFTLTTSCKKEIAGYENDPRVYFFERTAAIVPAQVLSKSFSFAPFSATLSDTTIYIKVKIMGLAAPVDRTFSAEAVASGTKATAGINYKLLNGTIKANQIEGTLPVVLYRTADLKTTTKQLLLKISDANDFKGGAQELNTFTLIWNDDYIKPDNWDTLPGLTAYFGVYSVVKYKFIIDVLGMSSFPITTSNVYNPEQLTNADMLDKKAILKAALITYNSTHPVLTDEFGLTVTFP